MTETALSLLARGVIRQSKQHSSDMASRCVLGLDTARSVSIIILVLFNVSYSEYGYAAGGKRIRNGPMPTPDASRFYPQYTLSANKDEQCRIMNLSMLATECLLYRLRAGICLVLAGLLPVMPAWSQEPSYRIAFERSFEDVVADIEVAIGEHNFRITGRHAIGAALADRLQQPYPPSLVLHFCNLDYARRLLEIDPDYLLYLPCRVVVGVQADKIIVEAAQVPVLDTRAAGLVGEINAILRSIIIFPEKL